MLWYISFLSADSLQRESGCVRTMGEAVEQKASKGGWTRVKRKKKKKEKLQITQPVCNYANALLTPSVLLTP